MRREMIWAGGLLACVLAVAIGVRAAESVPVNVKSDSVENAVIMMGDVSPDRLIPLPETYTVKRRYPDGHPMQNALAGAAESCALEETKAIYTSKLGTFAFRPGRGRRIADDLTTELVRDCTICSLRVRVTGGVEGGGGTFLMDFSLYDGCPAAGNGGIEIPGTRLRFRDLEDDADLFHDLILDYSDRGICDDGSSCLVSQQNCTGGTCDDGSACDTDDPNCGDGSECVSSGFVCVED
ncbi:MAG: hypothetical protein IIB57_10250, partial [Planctomycetes bacterium]|nr:hypothetical protein [Planctomycetota bacterium]